MSTTLPQLLDCRAVMTELGVKRHVAEQLMRKLPKVEVDGIRKSFVRRADLQRLIDENTRAA